MTKTMHEYPVEEIEFLGGKALISAHSRDSAFVKSIDHVGDGPFILNGLPIEFRIWLKKRDHGGSWYADSIFAYRLDREAENHPKRPATENQRSKLYRAAVAAVEELTDETLLRADIAKAHAELERREEVVNEAKKGLVDSLLEVEALKSALADLLSSLES